MVYKPRNCVVSKWSNWTSCSKKRGGIKTRERMVVKPSKYGGTPCPSLKENIFCNTQSGISTDTLRYNKSYDIKHY